MLGVGALFVIAASAPAARADATVSMGSISADGVRLDDVSCALDGGGLFGGLAVIAGLAKARAAIDACVAEPLGFSTTLTFRAGRTRAQIGAGGTAAQRACLERALAKAPATVEGRCTATLRTGPPAAKSDAGPKAPTSPLARTTAAQLRALVGQPLSSRAARALLAPIAAARTVSTFPDATYHSYKPHGLSLLLDGDRIKTIFVYAEGADGFTAYPGELPSGLTWTQTRADVEARLGPPRESGGDGVIPFWAEYGDGSLSVTYTLLSTTERANRLHHLALGAPSR